jgi:hypothetical protein
MPHLRPRPLTAALLALAAAPAGATDLVACMVAPLPNNPAYYGMATTITKLKCEFTREDFYPTLGELYRQGWRLIEVVGAEIPPSQGSRAVSPLYFLEREGSAPAQPAATPAPGQAPAQPQSLSPAAGEPKPAQKKPR